MRFRVYGHPKAQPRPRAFARKIGNQYVARVYEAGTAEAWKSDVVRAARPQRPESPIEGPVSVSIDFLLPRPKRLMRARDPDGCIYCDSKPDRDNLEKACLDALKTDGWFRDDAQVCAGEIRKFYHAKSEAPGAIVSIGLLEKEGAVVPPTRVARGRGIHGGAVMKTLFTVLVGVAAIISISCSKNNETCWVECPQSVLDCVNEIDDVSVWCQEVIRLQMESPESCVPNMVHDGQTWVLGVRCRIRCDEATPFPGLP